MTIVYFILYLSLFCPLKLKAGALLYLDSFLKGAICSWATADSPNYVEVSLNLFLCHCTWWWMTTLCMQNLPSFYSCIIVLMLNEDMWGYCRKVVRQLGSERVFRNHLDKLKLEPINSLSYLCPFTVSFLFPDFFKEREAQMEKQEHHASLTREGGGKSSVLQYPLCGGQVLSSRSFPEAGKEVDWPQPLGLCNPKSGRRAWRKHLSCKQWTVCRRWRYV